LWVRCIRITKGLFKTDNPQITILPAQDDPPKDQKNLALKLALEYPQLAEYGVAPFIFL
jgi:hypothetical protein